jgi:hypothetical protein
VRTGSFHGRDILLSEALSFLSRYSKFVFVYLYRCFRPSTLEPAAIVYHEGQIILRGQRLSYSMKGQRCLRGQRRSHNGSSSLIMFI